MNNVKCTLCESKNLFQITEEVRFGNKADVYRCKECGLTFLDQNSYKFPKDFYEGDYHQTYLTHIEPDAVNPLKYYEKMKITTKIWADRLRLLLKGSETILDVGCSTGHFMDLIRNDVKSIYGNELNKKEISFCRNRLGLDVSDEPLDQRFQKGYFDYITMIFVLEHIADPISFLKHLTQFLKPDGSLIILVPNIKDALISFYDIPEFRKFYYCIEHLYYYDENTIKKIFNKAELESDVEIVQEYPLNNHINWAFTHKPSNVISARSNLPNISLVNNAHLSEWELLWETFNKQYKNFLQKHFLGDRLWCVARRK